MSALIRRGLVFILLGCVVTVCAQRARAQTPAHAAGVEGAPKGTVTGRVTAGEKGVAGVGVFLSTVEMGVRAKAVARTTTEADGRYTLSGVPAGRYVLQVFAPAYVVEEMSGRGFPPGQPLTIAAGETIEEMNFTMARGGVITGRITDTDGRPIIAQQVYLIPADEQARGRLMFPSRLRTTDDRGVYRIYGLPAGRYRVSVGEDARSPQPMLGLVGRAHYPRTFYPGVTDEAESKIVEVTEGGEATDIDITVGARLKTHSVAGRVLDAESNQPLAGVRVNYGRLIGGRGAGGAFATGQMTNARGEFQLQGLVTGRYVVSGVTDASGELYSEPVTFEVGDSDVSGIEIKMRRGTSLSGVVVLEGAQERAALAQLSNVSIRAFPTSRESPAPVAVRSGRINADRTFIITGLPPARVRLTLTGFPQPPQGFSLVRVERGGVAIPSGEIDLSSGAPAGDVRVVLAYGNASVRGQVRVVNGTLPVGAQLMISPRRVGSDSNSMRPAQADARGFFLLEGLAAGEYDLYVNVFTPGMWRRPLNARQRVLVTGSGEIPVTITLDVSEQPSQTGTEARP